MGKNMKKFRIVLADDDIEWTQLFELAVSKKDRYELVGTAEDGDSAFQIIKKERPDIVISDILMPKTDGCYLVNSIRQMQDYRPIIYILSGIATDPIVRILQNLEIDYYSLKPVGVNTILSNLDLLIAMRGLMPDQSSQKITIQYTNKLEQRVEDILMEIGMAPGSKFYSYMRDALIACTIDGSNVNLVTKVLYPDIAKKYGVSTPSVERGLRYGIQTVRKTNAPLYQEVFSAMLGKHNISNTVFIATLANYIRKLG